MIYLRRDVSFLARHWIHIKNYRFISAKGGSSLFPQSAIMCIRQKREVFALRGTTFRGKGENALGWKSRARSHEQ